MSHKSKIVNGQRVPRGVNPGRWDSKMKIAAAKAAKQKKKQMTAKPLKTPPMKGRKDPLEERTAAQRTAAQKVGVEPENQTSEPAPEPTKQKPESP